MNDLLLYAFELSDGGDWLDNIVRRVIHFFKETSYTRMTLVGVIVLAAIYLWRRSPRR